MSVGSRLTQAELASEFAEHYESCVRLAMGLTGARALAEDVVQEAFLRLWERPPRLRDPSRARSYLFQTVVNVVRQDHRRETRLGQLLVLTKVRGGPEVDLDLQEDLRIALGGLAPRQRACVVLRLVLDLSEAETARLLGVSVGTVKSQTSRGIAKLRALMTVEEYR